MKYSYKINFISQKKFKMIFLKEVFLKNSWCLCSETSIKRNLYETDHKTKIFQVLHSLKSLDILKETRIWENLNELWKKFWSKLKYPEHAVVIEGKKCLIVDRLNGSSLTTYSELYSFLFIWRKFKRILEKHERI